MSQITTDSGLVIEDMVVGDGAEACAGQTVSVHYTGWLTNGSKFDSSKDRDEPFEFELGGRRERELRAGATRVTENREARLDKAVEHDDAAQRL